MFSRQRGSVTNPLSSPVSRFLALLKPEMEKLRRRRTRQQPSTVFEQLETRALLSALVVSSDQTSTGSITLTAADTSSVGDDLTINTGVSVASSAGQVTLNVGDNFFHQTNATVSAATAIVINFDTGVADPGSGGIAFLEGSFNAPGVTINGGADDDFFGLEGSSFLNSPVTINGAGGTLNRIEFDFTGVTNPAVTYTSSTSGVVTSDSHQDVAFSDISDILIFSNSGTFSVLTLDLSGLTTANDSAADTIEVISGGTNSVKVNVNTVELFDLDPREYDALSIIGSNDLDTLFLSLDNGIVAGPVAFAGGGGADILSVIGDGTTTAVYSPDATVTGSGTVDVDGNVVTFSGLAPVDISAMATASISLPSADDILTIENGLDYATNLSAALRVSGTSGGVAIESVSFRDIDALTIDTSSVDGVDTLTINSADNDHQNDNIAFRTGGVSTDGDSILLNGNITTDLTHLFSSAAITLQSDVILTSVTNGGVRFLDAPINGAQDLTINAGGVTNLNSPIGNIVPLTSLTTDAAGSTTIAQGSISTSGVQTYHDQVTLSVDTALTASTIVLNDDLEASPSGFQTLVVSGNLILGDDADDRIGAANALGQLIVSGTTTINSAGAGGANIVTADGGGSETGNQTFGGAVTLANDTTLLATGAGAITFSGTVDGAHNLNVMTPGSTNFQSEVGGSTALNSVTVSSAAMNASSVSTTGVQNWNGDTDIGTAVLTGSTIIFAEDTSLDDGSIATVGVVGNVALGSATDDMVTFDVAGKTTAGTDFDQLQVDGTVTIQGTLAIGGAFAATGMTGDAILLVDNDGVDAVVGTFAGLANGAVVSLGGENWRIFYDGGDGNDVELRFGLANISIADAMISEGDSGTTTVTFHVVVDSPSGGAFRVTYESSDGTATSSDYTAASGTLDFAGTTANETQTISIVVSGDELVELNESFDINLLNILDTSSVQLSDATAVGTIQNDESATVTINDVTLAEGDSGDTILTFNAVLDAAVDTSVTVDFATADGTATAGTDYAARSGAVTFAGTAGEIQTIEITVSGENLVELDEGFVVDLSGLVAAGRSVTIADTQGAGTISNDDQASLSIDDVSVEESASGTLLTFTVSTDNPVDTSFSVDYETADGTATVADNDYTAISATALAFAGNIANESQTLQVTIVGDAAIEIDEVFSVVLSNLMDGGRDIVISDGSGIGTILDDDGIALNLSATASSGTEADGTVITLTATAAMAMVGNQTVDVDISGAGITAADYQLSATSITIADGQTSGSVTFTIQDDSVVEAVETATATISNPSLGVRLGATRSQDITITSDDIGTISIADASITEGAAGTQQLTFTVTSDVAVQGGFTVDYATADDTALAGTDYVAASGVTTLTFVGNAGETQQVSVTVNGDTSIEPDESFFVNLSNATSGVQIADAQAIGTITTDDVQAAVNLSVVPSVGSEADQTAIVITATASSAVVGDQTVDVSIAGTDITAGDYSLTSATITILDGNTTGFTTLNVVSDGALEAATELGTATISNPSSGLMIGATASANFTIQDSTVTLLNAVDRYADTQPTLSWQAVPEAVRYEMWFSRVYPAGQRIYSDTNVQGTSWTPPAELDAGGYRYWVRGFDADGNATSWSSANTFEIRPTLVGPLNGAFTAQPTFEWEPVPFATGYTLFLRSDSGDEVISNIQGNTYTPSTDLPAGLVRWWIRPSDSVANLGWTTAGVVGVPPRSTLLTPNGNETDVTPVFNWSPISGAGRYILHVVNTDTNQVVIRDDNVATASYTASTALPAGNYRHWVKAIDAATDEFNSGLWSNPLSFSIIVTAATQDSHEDSVATLTAFVDVSELLKSSDPAEAVSPTRDTEVVVQPRRDQASLVVEDAELAILDLVLGTTETEWLFG